MLSFYILQFSDFKYAGDKIFKKNPHLCDGALTRSQLCGYGKGPGFLYAW